MSDVYAVRGRPTGRGRPMGPLLHAVPGTDRTRSALCGARVGGAAKPWPDVSGLERLELVEVNGLADLVPEPGPCPECAALLRVGATAQPAASAAA